MLDRIDKYLREIDIIETVELVGRMDIDELTEKIAVVSKKEQERILLLLDSVTRKEMEKLLEGGLI